LNGFAGIDAGRAERGLDGRIPAIPWFEREAVAYAISLAGLAERRPVEEIAGMKLRAVLAAALFRELAK